MNRCLYLILLVLVFFSAGLLTAQEVASVIFHQDSDYKFSEDILTYNVQTRKGSAYSVRVVNDDVKRLHGMGVFSDVASEVRNTSDGKVEVIFHVTPRPVVRELLFVGNKKYDTKKLKEHVKLATGVPLNDKELASAVENLRTFYHDEGLTDAVISTEIERIDATHIRIVIKIAENLRLRVNSVTFDGATVYKASEMRDAIATRYSYLSKSWLSWLPIRKMGLLDREELEKDQVRLRELYWRKGYLDFKVKDVKLHEVEGAPERIDVVFEVEEGEPYKVGKVNIVGATRFPETDLLPLLTLKTGDVYDVKKEDDDLERLEHKYSPLGYADFQKMSRRNPDFRSHTVDVTYYLEEGPLYRIRDIFISGNRWTKDHVIRRELPMLPQDPVDKNMLKVTKSRLMGMGYFEKESENGVEVTATNASEPHMKDINIQVKEKRFVDLRIGGGFSDTESVSGMISLTHSNFDILDPGNYFTGGGQKLRVAALMGVRNADFQVDFTEPWLFGIPLRLDVSGYWRESVFPDWNERRVGVTAQLTKRVFDDFTSATLGYTFEQVTIRKMNSDLGPIFQSQVGSDLVGRVFLKLDRDTRDSFINPKSGYNVSLYGAITAAALGATNNYYKVEFRGINYYPFLGDLFVLSTGIKLGSTGSFNGDPVPLYDRYFLGGGDSVRGFSYRSIGPEDIYGSNYGGQSMYVITAEVTHPIYSIVRGAVFCDIGDAMANEFGPIRTPNIGAGYGLRIQIPNIAMPIKLDLAYPVVNHQNSEPSRLRFHFNMGVSF